MCMDEEASGPASAGALPGRSKADQLARVVMHMICDQHNSNSLRIILALFVVCARISGTGNAEACVCRWL